MASEQKVPRRTGHWWRIAALFCALALPLSLPACSLSYNLHDRYTFDLVDGGVDGGLDAGLPCDPACADPEPHCERSTASCVECLIDEHCPADRPTCAPGTHTCQGCATSTECDRFSPQRRDLCDPGTGACVQCVLGDESRCSGIETCDLTRSECASVRQHTLRLCDPCTNDRQCPESYGCVPMFFDGAPRESHYCLRLESAGCRGPFAVMAERRTSLNGNTDFYCGLNEDLQTCEAVMAVFDGDRCDTDTDCPQPGGLCRLLRDMGYVCTYPCADSFECYASPGVDLCGRPVGEEVAYCGGGS